MSVEVSEYSIIDRKRLVVDVCVRSECGISLSVKQLLLGVWQE